MKNKICDKATSTLLHTIKRIIYACVCTLGERSPYFPQSMFTSSQFSVWAVDSFWFDRMDKIFPESTHRFMTVHARIFFTFGEGGEGVWTFPGKFKFSKNYRKYASELPTHTHHLGKMLWIRACLTMRKHILHFLLNFTINHLFFTIQFSFFQL